MSKSDTNPLSRINILDKPEDILEKCKKAVTDFTSQVTFEPEQRPGVSNLVTIHSLFTGKSTDEICNEVQHLDTGQYKLLLADVVIEHLKPIRKKFLEYQSSPEYLVQVLVEGREKAKETAELTMVEVKEKVGLYVENIKTAAKVMKTFV